LFLKVIASCWLFAAWYILLRSLRVYQHLNEWIIYDLL
jgi:hypothetical protein